MTIDDLLDEELFSCDGLWLLSLILLIFLNNNFDNKVTKINIYINEGKEGE